MIRELFKLVFEGQNAIEKFVFKMHQTSFKLSKISDKLNIQTLITQYQIKVAISNNVPIIRHYQLLQTYILHNKYKNLAKIVSIYAKMGNQQLMKAQNPDTIAKACCDKVSLYISNSSIDSSEVTCGICMEIYKEPRIMKCKHNFCEDCIKDWGKKKASCPYCRTEFKANKGNYGRIDKILQKKIKHIVLKCRSCCWSGSKQEFYKLFEQYPSLDDEPTTCPNNINIPDQNAGGNIQGQEKQQLRKIQTSTEEKEKPLTMTDCFDNIRQEVQAQNSFVEDEVFLVQTPIFRYMDLEHDVNRINQRWDDVFWNEDQLL